MTKRSFGLDELISHMVSFIVSKEMQAPRYFTGIHLDGSREQKEFIKYLKNFGFNSPNSSKILEILGPAIYKNAEQIAEKEGFQGIKKRLLYSLFLEKEEQDKFKEMVKKNILNDYGYLNNLIKKG